MQEQSKTAKEIQEKRKVTQVTEFFATKIEEDSKPKDGE